MDEKTIKRRAWIKNIAIIFLAVMLILTLFSNTFLNMSLPEVSAQYPQYGTITTKVRASGIIQANQTYEVSLGESRTIAGIAVKSGDIVVKGETLFLLEDAESEELKSAQNTLDDLETQYAKALVTAPGDYSTQQLEISNTQEDLSAARAKRSKMAEAEANVENARAAVTSAQSAVASASDKLAGLNAQLAELKQAESSDDAAIENIETQIASAENELLAAQTRLTSAQDELEYRQSLVTSTTVELDETIKSLERTLSSQQNALRIQQEEDSRNLQLTDIDLAALKKDVDEQKALVAKLKEKAESTEVKAQMGGTVSNVNCMAGETVEAGAVLAVLQISDKGYSTSFTVTNQQAKFIKPGDAAEIQYYWGGDAEARVLSVKNDPSDPGKSKLVTIGITGDVSVGDTMNFIVGQKGIEYDTVVPNSAIYEDSNGKFVLSVTAKSTPLGNRYTATRVDVNVISADDTSSAISGAVEGGSFIITASTKPLKPGDQVRLIEG